MTPKTLAVLMVLAAAGLAMILSGTPGSSWREWASWFGALALLAASLWFWWVLGRAT